MVSYILTAIILFGLSTHAQYYLETIEYYIKIYVSIFLIYRFNPFRHVEFTELDRKIVFSAGWFIFTTTSINAIITKYISYTKTKFLPGLSSVL
jgi:hypothetical protein